jgi:hypothetical protein
VSAGEGSAWPTRWRAAAAAAAVVDGSSPHVVVVTWAAAESRSPVLCEGCDSGVKRPPAFGDAFPPVNPRELM